MPILNLDLLEWDGQMWDLNNVVKNMGLEWAEEKEAIKQELWEQCK